MTKVLKKEKKRLLRCRHKRSRSTFFTSFFLSLRHKVVCNYACETTFPNFHPRPFPLHLPPSLSPSLFLYLSSFLFLPPSLFLSFLPLLTVHDHFLHEIKLTGNFKLKSKPRKQGFEPLVILLTN